MTTETEREFWTETSWRGVKPQIEEIRRERRQRSREEIMDLRRRVAAAAGHIYGPEKRNEFIGCRTWFKRYKCTADETHNPAFPNRCRDAHCAECGPRLLTSQWRRKYHLPNDLHAYKLRSLQPYKPEEQLLASIRKRFNRWRASIISTPYPAPASRRQTAAACR
jgi:hypothetical protein